MQVSSSVRANRIVKDFMTEVIVPGYQVIFFSRPATLSHFYTGFRKILLITHTYQTLFGFPIYSHSTIFGSHCYYIRQRCLSSDPPKSSILEPNVHCWTVFVTEPKINVIPSAANQTMGCVNGNHFQAQQTKLSSQSEPKLTSSLNKESENKHGHCKGKN
jgi:hypothetical protein